MTLDPSLLPQLQAAVRAVDAVRVSVSATAAGSTLLGVPEWRGAAGSQHAASLAALRDLVARAVASVATLEGELVSAAGLVGQQLAAEAAQAQPQANGPLSAPLPYGYGGFQ